jgi:membrane protease YdiL (CAAX protease family)
MNQRNNGLQQTGISNGTRARLLLEVALLFIAIPLLIYSLAPFPVLPALWLLAFCCWRLLLRDSSFDRSNLLRTESLRRDTGKVLLRFLVLALALALFVLITAPDLFFGLIRRKPLLWAMIMLLYPLLSVYPQELIYRTFFHHRYRVLFSNRQLFIVCNGLLFGFMHIVFHNWVAVLLTAAGGVLFAATYERSRSTLLVSLEHALFGCLVFTLGLGQFFYMGTISTISQGLQL